MSFAELLEPEDTNNNNSGAKLEPWVAIQQNTFINWVNDKLRTLDLQVGDDVSKEFADGVKLCKLMEVLKGQSIGRIKQKKDLNHYEASGNLALAMEAMRQDGVRLVNIGAEDIAGGNTKLILGMIWTLIRHYQIGSQTKIPPKKLMLAWINAVLHPYGSEVSNFSSDWNDGVALHGVIEFCKPGTFPDWRELSRSDRLQNCETAMRAALEEFDIPMVVSPENMSNQNLDELSGMTYLSYFMAVDAPGYKATLAWTKQQITPTPVTNFDTDWNNGYVLSALVQSMGGEIQGWPNIDTSDWTEANQRAMHVSESELGIKPIISAHDIANTEVDHIGVMAYAAWHMHAQTATPVVAPLPVEEIPAPPPHPPAKFVPPPPPVEPPPPPEAHVLIVDNLQMHKTTTVSVSTENLGAGVLRATATAPSGATTELLVATVLDGQHNVAFTPDTQGLWSVDITFEDSRIANSPYNVNVFDAGRGVISKDSNVAFKHEPFVFQVDVTRVGFYDVTVYVLHDGESVDYETVPEGGSGRQRLSFVPLHEGVYTVIINCGGIELPDSPFEVTSRHRPENANEGLYATGQGLRWAIKGKPAIFDVDLSASRNKDQDLSITCAGPSGREVDVDVKKLAEGRYRASYIAQEEGPNTLNILYDSYPLPGSPYTVPVRKANVHVRNLDSSTFVGHSSQFTVDASECGRGTIEIDSDLPIQTTEKVGEKVYVVTFIPKKPGHHDMSISFGGETVDGSPFQIEVLREEEIY